MFAISDQVEVDQQLLERVSYEPHPDHCDKPDTFRPHKSKCPDGVDSDAALNMLKEGLRRCMVPPDTDGLPSRVWAVDEGTGVVYEAKVTNRQTAEYHGYPLLEANAFRDRVISEWRQRGEA